MVSREMVTVEEWHRRLNSGDIEGAVALLRADVEVRGPRGAGRGVQLFRDWFGRTGAQLVPLRYYHRDRVVVVEEEGIWPSSDDGYVVGRQVIATLFTVEDGAITTIKRFDNLETAFEGTGMAEADRAM